MKDLVPKGTGNSRYLKSAVPANTTHEELINLLRNGTFPIDFNGLNTAGIEQEGTPLNKANLLTDNTAVLIWPDASTRPDDPTVNDALGALVPQISAKAKIATGSYVGTGTYNSANPCSLTFDFVPQIIIINPMVGSSGGGTSRLNPITYPVDEIYGIAYRTGSSYQEAFSVSVSYSGTTVNWYSKNSAAKQQNESNRTYYYVAIG